MQEFHEKYCEILSPLCGGPGTEVNTRTGAKIYSLPPTSFSLDMADRQVPMCGIRKTYPKTAAAEIAWFMQGSQDVSFISKYAPIWDKFTEDDGSTVEAAYGYRWRHHFGRDQIEDAICALVSNPTDRRIFISAWDPGKDGLGQPGKNVPCPVGFSLSIRENKLNCSLFIRSSDVFVGLPYDVMGQALLMAAIADSIIQRAERHLDLGQLHVTLAHPHLYDCHIDMADTAMMCEHSFDTFTMPNWTAGRIANFPDAYVNDFATRAKGLIQPEYSCRPDIVQ